MFLLMPGILALRLPGLLRQKPTSALGTEEAQKSRSVHSGFFVSISIQEEGIFQNFVWQEIADKKAGAQQLDGHRLFCLY
jgi:hypothetical protein